MPFPMLTTAAWASHHCPARHPFFVNAPSTASAGTPFLITVTALDAYNNTVTGYQGIVHFTSSDGQAVLPGNATLTNGVRTFTVTLKRRAAGPSPHRYGRQRITGTSVIAVAGGAVTPFGGNQSYAHIHRLRRHF